MPNDEDWEYLKKHLPEHTLTAVPEENICKKCDDAYDDEELKEYPMDVYGVCWHCRQKE